MAGADPSAARPGIAAALGLALAAGPGAAQELFAETKEQCAACHGVGDAEPLEGAPALGGIDAYYALLQLVAFREGDRENAIMNAMVGDMSDDDLRAASDWVASLERPAPPGGEADAARMEAGAELADANRCNTCHGADYLGGKQMPPLRHQREGYIRTSLEDFKAEHRIGARAAMVEVAGDLSDDDIATLAYYLAHLPG